jgi:hypothetical protein
MMQHAKIHPARRVHFRRALLELACCRLLPHHIPTTSFSALADTSLSSHLARLRSTTGTPQPLQTLVASSALAEAVVFLSVYGFLDAEIEPCKNCKVLDVDASENLDCKTPALRSLLLWLDRAVVMSAGVRGDVMSPSCFCCLHMRPTAFGRAAFLSSLAPEDAAMHAHELATIAKVLDAWCCRFYHYAASNIVSAHVQFGLSTEDTLPALFLLVPVSVEPRAAPQDPSGWALQVLYPPSSLLLISLHFS